MENQAVTKEAPTPRPRATHEQTRERNAKFAEMAQDPEVKKYLDNMPKSTHISYLRKLCQDRYGFTVPASLSPHQPRTRSCQPLMTDSSPNIGARAQKRLLRWSL